MSEWTTTREDELLARDDSPGFFIVGRSHGMRSHARATTLENRVIHGPVIYLVGGRLTASRPAPRATRRVQTPDAELAA